jgi:TRAP-type C4-dicarboxylate transport system permease small subunit
MASGNGMGVGAQPHAPAHSDAEPLAISDVAGGAFLERLIRILALIGGALLLVSIGLSVVSIGGRYALSAPLPGDYELVEIICAVAVFLFFPFTHARGANLTAEFFTSGLPESWNRVLDIIHDFIFSLIAALLAWRLGHGLVDKFHNGDSSILLQFPFWVPYTVAVACMWLLAVISLWRVAAGIGVLRR